MRLTALGYGKCLANRIIEREAGLTLFGYGAKEIHACTDEWEKIKSLSISKHEVIWYQNKYNYQVASIQKQWFHYSLIFLVLICEWQIDSLFGKM